MVKLFATLTITFVLFSGRALADEPNVTSAFYSQLDQLRVIVTIPLGYSGGDSFDFHGNDGSTCTVKTPGLHLNQTDGIEDYFRYANSETGFNEKHEQVVRAVRFTNSGLPPSPNHAVIQCTGKFKNTKEFLGAFAANDVATLSWAAAPAVESKTWIGALSTGLYSVTNSLLGRNALTSERGISSASLTENHGKQDETPSPFGSEKSTQDPTVSGPAGL